MTSDVEAALKARARMRSVLWSVKSSRWYAVGTGGNTGLSGGCASADARVRGGVVDLMLITNGIGTNRGRTGMSGIIIYIHEA